MQPDDFFQTVPSTDVTSLHQCDHFVQFYEREDFLLDALSGFIGSGLRGGDACVVIATLPHRNGLEARLQASGLDLPHAIATGQYLSLDAADTLSRFMVEDGPDPDRFAGTMAPVLARAAAGGRAVRAFGEMVALLWADGKMQAALRLEELWNDMVKRDRFSLFCAYPLTAFLRAADGDAFAEICMKHSRVIPEIPDTERASLSNPQTVIALLRQKAIALEAEIAERQKAEERLARREKELADFLENSVVGLHQVGPDGTVLWANKAELDLLGYAPQEYIGRHIAEFHVDPDVIDDILAKLRRGEAVYDYPARLRCKDGSVKHVLIHSNGCFEDGRFMHTRCFTQDVTEHWKAEQEIQRLNRELTGKVEELERSRADLSEKVIDLERFHDVAVGRELKMMELEKKLEALTSVPRDLP
ncbi:MEDS domain-containing protein [Candidatus Nitrospira bockiana]